MTHRSVLLCLVTAIGVLCLALALLILLEIIARHSGTHCQICVDTAHPIMILVLAMAVVSVLVVPRP